MTSKKELQLQLDTAKVELACVREELVFAKRLAEAAYQASTIRFNKQWLAERAVKNLTLQVQNLQTELDLAHIECAQRTKERDSCELIVGRKVADLLKKAKHVELLEASLRDMLRELDESRVENKRLRMDSARIKGSVASARTALSNV